MADLGTMAVATAVDVGKSVAGGFLNDYFNQRSEARADARNRSLIKDTPRLQQEGRRAVGLNPYGEGAQLPGMSAQSQTEVPTGFNTLADIMAMERLELDKSSVVADNNLKDAQAGYYKALEDATIGGEERADEMFPVSLYGMRLSIELKEFDYSQAVQKAPLILRQLENDVEYQEWEIVNAEKDSKIKDETINEKRENVLNLQATRGLIKAQEMLAYSGIPLNDAQKELFNEQKGLVNAEKQFTRLQAKDMFETLKANISSGYYKSYSEQSVKRLSYELEKLGRTLWDSPDDSSIWWYLGNALWNIQNCLTLSGSASSSSGSRVVTKK